MGNLKLGLEVKKDDNVTEDTTIETRANFKDKVLKVMKKLKKTDSKKTEEQKMQKKKQKETEAERWYQRDDMIDIDQYIAMFGGTAGAALTLTGVAAATAFYICTRPKPEKPLVTLHEQSLLEPAQQAQLLP